MKDEVLATRKLLQDLKDLHTTGFLDETQYAENLARLERRLIDAVMKEAPSESALSGPNPVNDEVPQAGEGSAPVDAPQQAAVAVPRWVMVVGACSLFAMLLAAGSWFALRSPSGAGVADLSTKVSVSELQGMSPDQLAATTTQLATRLQAHPGEADGWVLLARAYSLQSRHPEAAAAYAKAVTLRADDAQLLVDYAQARAVTNNGYLSGEPQQLIDRALKLQPDNLNALVLAGTAAADRKDYAAALAYWGKVIELAPADSAVAAKARNSLAETRQLAQPHAASSPATSLAPNAGVSGSSISGTVTLAPALAARVGANDTVFVYARAVDGPAVPLAVIRKQVKDLPLLFSLDDSMAMWPSAKVSDFSRIIVTARVSKAGDGVAKSGDLQGQSGPVAAGMTGLQIEIGTVVQK